MAKTFITAHIKLEDNTWQDLGRHAQNQDLTTAQLVRKILRAYVEGQVFAAVEQEGPITRQDLDQRHFAESAYEAGWDKAIEKFVEHDQLITECVGFKKWYTDK